MNLRNKKCRAFGARIPLVRSSPLSRAELPPSAASRLEFVVLTGCRTIQPLPITTKRCQRKLISILVIIDIEMAGEAGAGEFSFGPATVRILFCQQILEAAPDRSRFV